MSAMSQREYDAIINKQRRLPDMLRRARQRVRQLEAEALRYGMKDLLTDPRHVNNAWDRAIDDARAECGSADV